MCVCLYCRSSWSNFSSLIHSLVCNFYALLRSHWIYTGAWELCHRMAIQISLVAALLILSTNRIWRLMTGLILHCCKLGEIDCRADIWAARKLYTKNFTNSVGFIQWQASMRRRKKILQINRKILTDSMIDLISTLSLLTSSCMHCISVVQHGDPINSMGLAQKCHQKYYFIVERTERFFVPKVHTYSYVGSTHNM